MRQWKIAKEGLYIKFTKYFAFAFARHIPFDLIVNFTFCDI